MFMLLLILAGTCAFSALLWFITLLRSSRGRKPNIVLTLYSAAVAIGLSIIAVVNY